MVMSRSPQRLVTLSLDRGALDSLRQAVPAGMHEREAARRALSAFVARLNQPGTVPPADLTSGRLTYPVVLPVELEDSMARLVEAGVYKSLSAVARVAFREAESLLTSEAHPSGVRRGRTLVGADPEDCRRMDLWLDESSRAVLDALVASGAHQSLSAAVRWCMGPLASGTLPVYTEDKGERQHLPVSLPITTLEKAGAAVRSGEFRSISEVVRCAVRMKW